MTAKDFLVTMRHQLQLTMFDSEGKLREPFLQAIGICCDCAAHQLSALRINATPQVTTLFDFYFKLFVIFVSA
jgi:hypothetical protein